MPTVPELNAALAKRLVDIETACIVDWVRAMESETGNPFGITVQTFGGATATICSQVQAQVWNRVFGLSPDDLEHVPAIIDFYKTHGVTPLFDLSPYAFPPYWEAPHMPQLLAGQYALYQCAFHQML
jgi:hypothetical protein